MTDEPEIVDLLAEEDDNIRGSVPLHMLQGNMDVLLKLGKRHEFLPCEGVSLIERDRGVVLLFTSTPEQKTYWRSLGFRTVALQD